MSHGICKEKHWPSPPQVHQNWTRAKTPIQIAWQRWFWCEIMQLYHTNKHCGSVKSKMRHSFKDSKHTCLCQLCHSEPAGCKASSHLEGELTALALHSLCPSLFPDSGPLLCPSVPLLAPTHGICVCVWGQVSAVNFTGLNRRMKNSWCVLITIVLFMSTILFVFTLILWFMLAQRRLSLLSLFKASHCCLHTQQRFAAQIS